MNIKELYISEKPAVATAIADALEDTVGRKLSKKRGYYIDEESGIAVAWCIGHMLQLLEPEEYDKKLGVWSFDTLPLFFPNYKHKPSPHLKDSLDIIVGLLKHADCVIHAGDTDDEGQLLVDEILRLYNYKNEVRRILINDNTKVLVQKAIARKEPNEKYEHLGWRAEARSLCDLLVGFNLTRAYTLKEQAEGGEGVISIGRVQTPILGMVVRRDRENSGHQKQYFYELLAQIGTEKTKFVAKFLDYSQTIKEKISNGENKDFSSLIIDDEKRLINKDQLILIANACKGQNCKVIEYSEKNESVSPPLPYNINKLQQDASERWGYKPKEIVEITQQLKDTYQLITYNRSDCQYLSDEAYDSVEDNLRAIDKNTMGLGFNSQVKGADKAIKGRVFNSEKVGAHHAIVPTHSVVDLKILTKEQRNIYLLITQLYVAQFYPKSVYSKKEGKLQIGEFIFRFSSRVKVSEGWESLFKKDNNNDEEKNQQLTLEGVENNTIGKCLGLKIDSKETKPKEQYSMKTLLSDLTRAAKYMKNQDLAKILIERDKDKASENGGIGTSATRHVAIETLFERGFLEEKGKKIVSTAKGQSLYDKVTDNIKYPDMSAIWSARQDNIKNKEDVLNFAKQVMKELIIPEVKKIKGSVKYFKCPKCDRNMNRIVTDKGAFWGCSGYKDEDNKCSHSMDDKDGKPVERAQRSSAEVVSTDFDCIVCKKNKLNYKKGKKTFYYECGDSSCKQKYWKSKQGKKPDYDNLPKDK